MCIWLVTPFVYLIASQHCHFVFTKLLTPRRQTFNLTHTISYGSYGTCVIILYLYSLIEDTALSLGLSVKPAI